MPTLVLKDERALDLRRRLLLRPRTLFLRTIADEMQVSERWLQHLIAGKAKRPLKLHLNQLEKVLQNHNL